MTKGSDQILVRYWYLNRRETWAADVPDATLGSVLNHVRRKFIALPDVLRHYGRSDVAIIRVIAPVHGSDVQGAAATLDVFTRALHPAVMAVMPE